MTQVRYDDTFLPHPGPTQAGLIQTASNGGHEGEGRSGVVHPQIDTPPLSLVSVKEAERELAVLGEVDVLVCGGGPAGTAAALATRQGVPPRGLDAGALRRALQNQGVVLDATERPDPRWSADQSLKPKQPEA